MTDGESPMEEQLKEEDLEPCSGHSRFEMAFECPGREVRSVVVIISFDFRGALCGGVTS